MIPSIYPFHMHDARYVGEPASWWRMAYVFDEAKFDLSWVHFRCSNKLIHGAATRFDASQVRINPKQGSITAFSPPQRLMIKRWLEQLRSLPIRPAFIDLILAFLHNFSRLPQALKNFSLQIPFNTSICWKLYFL